ncbi:MAG: SCO family protein [Armatimonadota bacterium]|nr:SCO family protein [Armatimonadota bacterium]MDR7450967.1 SCO family protein [Armatimonadota bacterium]MDR7466012.1 SCO family protein [Armatimonadota bacterium]MDR7494077.1 SCO family protein [Armatimonadota bacterium]MDR7504056.1 SCO family protein [Armatimonadota bacterium]
MRGPLAVLLSALLLEWGGGAARAAPHGMLRGLPILPPEPVIDFTLVDQHGRPFRLRDQRGSLVVLTFGFTSCLDLCPLTLGTLKRAYNALGPERRRVRVALITVDPRRDTPTRLKTYLASFHPDFIGLTGPEPERLRVYKSFGVVPERYMLDAHRLVVNHPPAIYVIDRTGYLRVSYNWGGPAEDVAHDIRVLLQD